MASFISFVYRRQASAPASFSSPHSPSRPERGTRLSLHHHEENAPPGVTSSGSIESIGWVSSDEERFLSSPVTPEGLRPRQSVESLRRELKLSPIKGRKLSGVAKLLATMEGGKPNILANDAQNDNIRRHQGSDDEEDMILPPPDYFRRRQPTFDSSTKSPMVSTSSFYSRSTQDRPVAMSPVLRVGQARTAVGALVALREAANHRSNADMADSSYPSMSGAPKTQSPRGKFLGNKQTFPMGVLPPRIDIAIEKEEATENENVPYMPVDTPTRRSMTEFEKSIEGNIGLYESPSSLQLPAMGYMPLLEEARKGMDSSFSSRAELIGHERKGSYDFEPIQNMDVSSKSSLVSLGKVDESGEQFAGYDENEEEMDAAIMARKFRNQQMRKQVQMQQHEDEFADCDDFVDEYDDDDEEEDYDEYDEEECDDYEYDHDHDCGALVPFEQSKCTVPEDACVNFEDALVRRKARNQRHEKEAYLLDVVARLRDNLELVADIENAASSTVAAMGNWFVKTPMNEQNLMTGFSGEERSKLLDSLDSILRELDVAQPEEFILSPSKVPVLAATHDTLSQALLFCRSLISSAIPRAEKNKMVMELPAEDIPSGSQRLFVWKCLPELHFALGLTTPQSPETVRGGGTSLFSLPEESGAETPHTSNVSLATSITSTHTPYRRRSSAQTARPQLILQQDGLQLRHTVEVVSSLLQKLSLACVKLTELNSSDKGKAQTYVQACEEIKKIYLELLAIKKEDARALSEAFYLESQTPTCDFLLTREVSLDDEEGDDAVAKAKMAQVVALASAMRKSSFGPGESRRRNRGSNKSNGGGVTLFSTEDMREEAAPAEFDDLRRQVGSYDRDDSSEGEERDGPSLDDSRESRDSEESDWSRRMYQNVSLAAHSIRSLMEDDEQRE